jgi:hypothetical protein
MRRSSDASGDLATAARIERAAQGRTSYLITVLGPAGIGKSRLAHEFATSVADRATVLTGRCLSYGAGVTYCPGGDHPRGGGDPRGDVSPRRRARRRRDRCPIAGAVGADAAGVGARPFWAVGSLFAAFARPPARRGARRLALAEPMLLDLLEHLVDATRTAPVLLLCLARSELLDLRPSWGGGKLNASTILLEPLSGRVRAAHRAFRRRCLDPAVTSRLTEAAEGNPLFSSR